MITEAKALEAIQDLIDELENIYELVVDDGLNDGNREELKGQSGSIETILEGWSDE